MSKKNPPSKQAAIKRKRNDKDKKGLGKREGCPRREGFHLTEGDITSLIPRASFRFSGRRPPRERQWKKKKARSLVRPYDL